MAHWKDAVITNDGVEMLNEWLAGRKITITSAYGGTGTVDQAHLAELTELVNVKQALNLLGEVDEEDGKTVMVQVSNAEVLEEYQLDQVGVFAALDVDRDPDAEERLLFIMQDTPDENGKGGVTVPSMLDASFLLELYCAIGITNNGRFEVSVSSAGIVTLAYLRDALDRAVKAHNEDLNAHNGLLSRMGALEIALNGSMTIIQNGDPDADTVGEKGQHYINLETGAEFVCTGVDGTGYIWEPVDNSKSIRDALAETGDMGTTLDDVDARLGLLELMYRTQVSGNPFTASFENLDDVLVTGVWNATLKRVEF